MGEGGRMNVLEKILEEIEEKFKTADAEKCDCEELCDVEDWYDSGYIDGQLSAHEKCMDIIRSHMDDVPKCGECSRRKFYMQGYEDGKKDDGFVKGVSERNWSDSWLAEQNRKESIPKTFNGKEYTLYEAKQQQRKMETAMRAQREKAVLLKQGRADPDDVILAKAKYQGQLNEYSRFCKKMGLTEERERIYYDMRGRIATNSKQQNAKYTSEMFKNAERDSKQYHRYKNILGDNVGSLADFRQTKYNEPKKFSALKKKVDTYSDIDKKEWSSEFKQKSKEAYARFEKEGIYLSVHALSRLPRLNKPGYLSIEETDVITTVRGKYKYLEGENKLIFFDEKCQLAIAKNKNTDDIVSIIRRKRPKEEWESV